MLEYRISSVLKPKAIQNDVVPGAMAAYCTTALGHRGVVTTLKHINYAYTTLHLVTTHRLGQFTAHSLQPKLFGPLYHPFRAAATLPSTLRSRYLQLYSTEQPSDVLF